MAADPLPEGECRSVSGDNSFRITIRVYYTFKITTTITKTRNGCCGNPAPPANVTEIITSSPAPDFTHEISFRYNILNNTYEPVSGAMTRYESAWNRFQTRLETARAAIDSPERITSTVRSPPIICIPTRCEDGVRQPAVTCIVITTTKKKVVATSAVVNSTITSSDAVCSFT